MNTLYIRSRIGADAESLDLLQFVRFEYLSSECILYFLSDFPSSIDRRLWESISRAVEFPLKEAKSLEGIISYLTRKHGGNVQDNGIVTITSKSVCNDHRRNALRRVADFASDACFWSNGEPGEWVCLDFHEMGLRPTHYTIKSYLLKSWVIESSLSLVNWTEIDRKTDNDNFNAELGPECGRHRLLFRTRLIAVSSG
jgi:hypothetical protein